MLVVVYVFIMVSTLCIPQNSTQRFFVCFSIKINGLEMLLTVELNTSVLVWQIKIEPVSPVSAATDVEQLL